MVAAIFGLGECEDPEVVAAREWSHALVVSLRGCVEDLAPLAFTEQTLNEMLHGVPTEGEDSEDDSQATFVFACLLFAFFVEISSALGERFLFEA